MRLRYSPVNWLAVNWSFADCALPRPIQRVAQPPVEDSSCPCPVPLPDPIEMFSWDRYLSEVLVGIDNPDEEIAASYIRQTAIDFADQSRVLVRQITLSLQPCEDTYPLDPHQQEQVAGIFNVLDDCQAHRCNGSSCDAGHWTMKFNEAQQTVTFCGQPSCGTVTLLAWVKPKEDACLVDAFLWRNYRRPIAQAARTAYSLAVHFRDAELLRVLQAPEVFARDISIAKVKASRALTWQGSPSPRRAFGRGCC